MGAFTIAPMIEMRSYRTTGGLTLLHRVSQYPQLMQSAQKTLDLALSALTKGKLKAAWEHAEQAETIAILLANALRERSYPRGEFSLRGGIKAAPSGR